LSVPATPERNLPARYNICPTTTIDAVIGRDAKRELVPMRRGLVPSWWKKPLKEYESRKASLATVISLPSNRRSMEQSRRLARSSRRAIQELFMKLATTMLVVGAMFASTALANAQGASEKTPGDQMQDKGSVKGSPGASGYAPGQEMQKKGSVKGTEGASGYAPGRSTTGSKTDKDDTTTKSK